MIDFAFGDSLYGGRTEQVRWQQSLGGGSLAVALENPSDNSIANPLGLPGEQARVSPISQLAGVTMILSGFLP